MKLKDVNNCIDTWYVSRQVFQLDLGIINIDFDNMVKNLIRDNVRFKVMDKTIDCCYDPLRRYMKDLYS
jgi:hypothetical protein